MSPVPLTAAEPSRGFPIDQLEDLMAKSRRLNKPERAAFVNDVRNVRTRMSAKRDPWVQQLAVTTTPQACK